MKQLSCNMLINLPVAIEFLVPGQERVMFLLALTYILPFFGWTSCHPFRDAVKYIGSFLGISTGTRILQEPFDAHFASAIAQCKHKTLNSENIT